jgi:hypothetical protein
MDDLNRFYLFTADLPIPALNGQQMAVSDLNYINRYI